MAAEETPSAEKVQVGPEVYNPDCANPKNHDEADTCIQRRASRIAQQALGWTVGQSIIGLVGLGAIAFTLIYTAKATRAATDAATASIAQAKIAELALTGINRPYVVPIIVGHTLRQGLTYADLELSRGAFRAVVAYRNFGQSPAVIKSTALVPGISPAGEPALPLNEGFTSRSSQIEMGAWFLKEDETSKVAEVFFGAPPIPPELRSLVPEMPPEDGARGVLLTINDRVTYADLLGNETSIEVRYEFNGRGFDLALLKESGYLASPKAAET